MAKKKSTAAQTETKKELTPEEVFEQLTIAKTELKEARTPAKRIRMKHKCMKTGSVPTDKKVAKELAELEKVVAEKIAKRDELQELYDANKPKKEAGERNTKYEYPEGLSDAEKKKFRAKMRRDAKGGEEGEEKPKKSKKAKDTEEDAPKETKKAKKGKKSSKDQEDAHEAAKNVDKKTSTKKKIKKSKKEADQEDD